MSSKVELCIFLGQLAEAYRTAAKFHAGVLHEERAASASAGGPEPSPARSRRSETAKSVVEEGEPAVPIHL
eukprot:7560224-Lingulodinium_polyedra.AAC.1